MIRTRSAKRVATTLWVVFAAVCGVVCSGCHSVILGPAPTCKVPKAVELEIETSDRVNLDADGRALPTQLRLYQLTELSFLQMATFEDIWQRAKETLGATLVAVEELTTYPGQVMVRRFDRNEKADYLVGVAIFRNPIGATWRTIQEFPLPGDPCKEHDDADFAPEYKDLRIRMFLEDYRIESVNNYAKLPKRSCGGNATCPSEAAPNELPPELRHRRLRDFEEDPSRPRATAGGGEQQ